MSLLVLLCDEAVPVIRRLVLTRVPNANARNKDSRPYSIQILWLYITGSILKILWQYEPLKALGIKMCA